ncbi:MAG: hypothetical protein JNK69_04865 [Saprospiraceae bacterium]|nr:hypothetical protein [Candidatus Vicinibacter proximus]MBL7822717.1 hypothetical protein [Saprospiraceae bacterium]MCC6844295.1 hypothetical protein [Saprospiraceae bacterium]HRG34400.1 cohesin domain-containing protein [Saprospiraceae bacterium]
MEKTIFTSPISTSSFARLHLVRIFIAALFVFTFASVQQTVSAQCSLACNGLTQISLDQNCRALVTAAMILNDTATQCPGAQYQVTVLRYKKPIPTSPVVTDAEIGQHVEVEIKDLISGNKCWGTLVVEDKLPPVIECRRDTIPCFAAATFTPYHYDACTWDTLILLDEIIQPLNCDPNYIKRVIKKYIARDAYNNTSAICTDTTLLERFDTSRVICPEDRSLATGRALNCKDLRYNRIPLDSKGHPHPSYTGVPLYHDTILRSPLVLDTIALWPVRDIYCNIAVTYEDIDLGRIGCVQKYMRMWSIREWWCSGERVRTCIQLIEIVDREAPYVHCPYPIDATTDGNYKCEGTVYLPPAVVFDSCGGPVRVDVVYPGGILKNQNGGTVKLPVGEHNIVYRAYDDCYNVDSCIVLVRVLDKTAPVAICDRETVVSLSVDGRAHVYAKTFDDGSYDDCHIDSMLVRRMNDGPCDNDRLADPFRPFVEFCCEDVGRSILVVFRVKDKSGNYNDCMVNIEVQDKLKPTCKAPVDLTVSCDYHFDINNLNVFGEIQTDSALIFNTRTIRFKKNCFSGVDTVFNIHDGFAHDNCNLSLSKWYVDNRTQCNVGTITRYWEVRDANGVDTCKQVITFFNYCPFRLNSDIIWPKDSTFNMCFDPNILTPERTGRPKAINEDKCDLLGYSWEDHVFRFVNGSDACYKIIRKWKAIDWCQFVYNSATRQYEYVTATHEQIIKVNNLVDPTITGVFTDTTFCTLDSCFNGPAVLTADLSDDCTPGSELAWEYLIDLDNNGIYDIVSSGIGNRINASGRYKLGNHTIKFVVEDKCGNKVARERRFSIINCKQPTPYCLNGVAIDLMPMDTNQDGVVDTAMIQVWASDLDRGSYQVCGNRIVLSFSKDTADKFRNYNCSHLGQQAVEIWVTDAVTGQQAFCRTFIEVQDNNKACQKGTLTSGNVSGLIIANTGNSQDPINKVEVELKGSNLPKYTTTKDGRYAFIDMKLNGATYTVAPFKNDDHGNGISTADIIKIQKHILGLEPLKDPYLFIAADVNNSKTVTSADIIELRKLILGQISKFSKNDSWAFVDKNYKFVESDEEVLNENFPRNYVINPFNQSMIIDFRGIKIGDLNGSVVASNASSTQSRSNDVLSLVTPERNYSTNEELTVPIQLSQAKAINGYQFTLQFDPTKLELVDVISGVSRFTKENMSLSRIEEGLLAISWNSNEITALQNYDNLFSLKFKALSKGQISTTLQLNSTITQAEAYNASLESMDIRLGYRNSQGSNDQNGLVLYQNQPNPFSDLTVIGFDMPRAAKATLTVYDLNSRTVLKSDIQAVKGYNSIQINHSQLGVTGVLYYQLDAEGYTATRRMVVIQ